MLKPRFLFSLRVFRTRRYYKAVKVFLGALEEITIEKTLSFPFLGLISTGLLSQGYWFGLLSSTAADQ